VCRPLVYFYTGESESIKLKLIDFEIFVIRQLNDIKKPSQKYFKCTVIDNN